MTPDNKRAAALDQRRLHVTSLFTPLGDDAVVAADATLDEQRLGALGYKQEFKRDLSVWDSLGVAFTSMGVVPCVASTMNYGLGYAGTGGFVWGWLAAALCVQPVALSMAELCSSMPTTGGLYYAAAALAPAGWAPAASWFVGWCNVCGYLTGPCSVNYALAAMLVTCGEIAYPDAYTPQTWHTYLVFLGLLALDGVVTTQSTRVIGWINRVSTVWNLVILVILVVWLPVGSINSPKTNDDRRVWTEFQNGTEWPVGWSTIMGFLSVLWTMAGYDVPFHLAEESSNASVSAPRAIVLTAQLCTWLGWAVVLAIAYTVTDVSAVVSSRYGQPFGSLCLQVLGRRAGLAMMAVNMSAQALMGQGCTIAASRVAFAFARDGALPGSRWWSRVDARTRTPVCATWGILGVSALLGLLMFAGDVAIGAVFSIGAIAQYTAFTTPIALKLFFDRGRFQKGPWNLGRWSKPANAFCCAWWLLIVPALCFPTVRGANLTLQTMNWTCVIYGGAMVLAMLYYAVSARKWFEGPRVNVEHMQAQLHEQHSTAGPGLERNVDAAIDEKQKH